MVRVYIYNVVQLCYISGHNASGRSMKEFEHYVCGSSTTRMYVRR